MHHHRRSRKASLDDATETPMLIKLWGLRLLIPTGRIYKMLSSPHGFLTDSVLSLMRAFDIKYDEESGNPNLVQKELLRIYRDLEHRSEAITLPPVLESNLKRLAQVLKLSEAENHVLAFTTLMKTDHVLSAITSEYEITVLSHLHHTLAIVLDLPDEAIRQALSQKGILHRSNLLQVHMDFTQSLCGRIDLYLSGFAETIMIQDADPMDLLRDVVRPAPAPTLSVDDFPQLKQDIPVLKHHLARTLMQRRPGVNILIHGAPGTGKTELSRILGQILACPVFEVSSQNLEGDAVDGHKRIRALRTSQTFLSSQQALLVFDEAEDIFSRGKGFTALFGQSIADSSKGWMIRTLEENSVPTIWLSNQVNSLDPAFVRRFDIVLELPTPPRSIRQAHLTKVTRTLLSDQTNRDLANIEHLTPAVVTRAADVIDGVRDELDQIGLSTDQAFSRLISSTLQAQGYPSLRTQRALVLPEIYDPELTPVKANVYALIRGLQQHSEARICLYGPPGTGKTAFARWLSEKLDKPLLIRRASDLLSQYHGETEQKIAAVFHQAEAEDAVLLIDEVDSFLAARSGAVHHWEISQINEMLTQLESFTGLFIASTNMMDSLDPAAMRRFDLKLEFHPLSTQAAGALFKRYCDHMGLGEPATNLYLDLSRLTHLTPGDFVAISRRHLFSPISDPDALVHALRQEHEHKREANTKIGFI